MCEVTSNRRLVSFLTKVRNSEVHYHGDCIERLAKALPKDEATKEAIIKSLECGADKLLTGSSAEIHLILIAGILSAGDWDFWDCDAVRTFVFDLLRKTTDASNPVILKVLFSLYSKLDEKHFIYGDEEVIAHALQLLNEADLDTKCYVCIYLDKVFARKFKAEWAVAVADILMMSLKTYSANITLCRRLSQLLLHGPDLLPTEYSREIVLLVKDLPIRSMHFDPRAGDLAHMSTNFYICKLLAEFVQRKKVDDDLLFDNRWRCIHIRTEVMLQLIAMGRKEFIRVVSDTSELRLIDWIELKRVSNEVLEGYFERGLSLLSERRDNVSWVREFVGSLSNPSDAMLDLIYHVLVRHKCATALNMDALLRKSETWSCKMISVLAAQATEQLSSAEWGCKDNALDELSLLADYGYVASDVIEQITEMVKNDEEYYVRKEALKFLSKVQNDKEVSRLAAELLLTDTNSCPKAEAAKILLDGLPQTEQLCLKVVPKVLYDDDIELHRVVIEICGKLIAGGRNNEMREMLEKFQEDEVDCYDELNEILHSNNSGRSQEVNSANDELEYIFSELERRDDKFDKDCYDF